VGTIGVCTARTKAKMVCAGVVKIKAKMMSAGMIWAQRGCCKAIVCVLSLNQPMFEV